MVSMSMDDGSIRKYVLVGVTLSAFFSTFMASSISIALPSIAEDLKMDAVLMGWVPTAYLIAAAMLLVPFGKIADIHGRKKVFISGLSLYTLASLLCALSPSGMLLIAFRFLQGFGAAMLIGTGTALVISVFPLRERGKALGVNHAAVYSGLSLGPFIGGFLTHHFGWRSIFIANVPMGSIVIALIIWKLKGEWAAARGEKFDIPGTVIYGIMLIAMMYGFSELPALWSAWLILAGVLALVAFVKWEMRVQNPILDVSLFRNNAAFAFSNLAALLNYCAVFAVTFLVSLYLQYIKGFSPQHAGLILISQPVVMAIFSPITGRLSDRFEPRLLAAGGMAVVVVGLSLLTLLTEETALAFIIVALVLLGFGGALFSSPNVNAVMSSVQDRFYGVAAATQATMRQVGMAFSMGIAMLLFAVCIGRVQITPEYHELFLKSVKVAFIIFACFSFGAVFASLARVKVR